MNEYKQYYRYIRALSKDERYVIVNGINVIECYGLDYYLNNLPISLNKLKEDILKEALKNSKT